MIEEAATRPSSRVLSALGAADDELDLSRLWGVLVDGVWWIVAATVAFALGGTAYTLLATPIFQADALLQVEDENASLPGLSDLTEMFGSEGSASAEIEIVRSRMVVGDVIDTLKLDIFVKPEHSLMGASHSRDAEPEGASEHPSYRQAPTVVDTFVNALRGPQPAKNAIPFAGWGDDQYRLRVQRLDVPDELLDQELTLYIRGPQQLELRVDDITILQGAPDQDLHSADNRIALRVSELRAPVGASFTLIRHHKLTALQQLLDGFVVAEQGKDTGILKLTLADANPERARQILDALTESYLLQNVQRQALQAEKSLEFLNEQLPEIQAKLNKAEDALNRYRAKAESVDLSLEAQAMLDQQVALEARLNEVKVKESELRHLYTRKHPAYISIMEQRANIEAEKKRLDSMVQKLPETQQQIFRLTRDVEVDKEIYLQLVNRSEELKVVKAGSVGNVRILDNAQVQPKPIAPKKGFILALTTLLGVMVGVGAVLARDGFKRRLENPEVLEQEGFNVYATLPLSETETKFSRRLQRRAKRTRGRRGEDILFPLLATTAPGDVTIEALRSLRTSLYFAMADANNNVLMISGPSPGVGKSFVTANLGAVLAQSGQRVLLIDGDIRKGHLHKYFGGHDALGLSHYLSGQVEHSAIIRHTDVDGIDFIARGVIAPNPSELLMNPRLQRLLEDVSSKYDLVLIDTPPILAVTDPAIVGKLAGTSLIVVRFGVNTLKEVELTFRRFEQNGVRVQGCVFNALERRASNTYGYGYGYYDYEYGDKKKSRKG